MKSDDIIAAFRERGLSCRMVAEAIEISPATLSLVINRKSRSQRIANSVARALGLDVAQVFPDVPEYLPHTPSRRQRRANKVQALRADLSAV